MKAFLLGLAFLSLVASCQKPPAHFEDRDLFLISKNGKHGFIDRSGQIRIKPQFYALDAFHEGLARAKVLDGGWGYIDKIETVVIPFQFEEAENFQDGLARVKKDGVWRMIDRNGVALAGPAPERPAQKQKKSEGPIPAKSGSKWGYKDRAGNWILQPQFDWADEFSNGLAKVEFGPDQAYIDEKGSIVWRYAK